MGPLPGYGWTPTAPVRRGAELVSASSPLLAFVPLACLVSGPSAIAFSSGRVLNGLYADDALWIVAQYSAPAAIVALAAINALALGWLFRQVFVRRLATARLMLHALGLSLFTLPLGLELGMGIYYQQVTGELRIVELVLTRAALDLPSTPDGVCVDADLGNAWSWRLNETRLRPRLLPLPLDDRELRERLTHPGECDPSHRH
jgi:hypothetical protein